jgi:hypothetical protein
MSSGTLLAPCPPSVHREPPVPGLERVGDSWRLTVDRHRALIRDVTGVDPVGSLTLQGLTTIAARLEGFVEQRKRRETRTEQTTPTAADQSATGPVGRLWLWLRTLIRTTLGEAGADGSATADRFDSYATETVWHLSQFFRAAADEEYEQVSVDTAAAATAATSETGTE